MILGNFSNVTKKACFGRKRPTGPTVYSEKRKNRRQDLKHGSLICGNTAGHMIKPGFYRAKNPHALKTKTNKQKSARLLAT